MITYSKFVAFIFLFALSSTPVIATGSPQCPAGTFIVPYPPGGPTDALGRLVAKELSETWAGNMVVINKPGAGTIIATNDIAKSPPNSCVIGIGGLMLITGPFAHSNLPYDADKDLSLISLLATFPERIVVSNDFPAQDVKGLIEYAKENPGLVTYATSGMLGFAHLTGEYFADMAGIEMIHILYKGSSAAYPDVISGRVPVMIDSGPPILELIRTGKVRALAIASAERDPLLPDVPTLRESGIDIDVSVWLGLIANASVSDIFVQSLSAAVDEIMNKDNVKKQMAALGFTPGGGSPEEFRNLVESEKRLWRDLIERRDIKMN